MATPDDIDSNFQFLGISVSKDILKKCVELCSVYNFDAEEFVDQWCAYAASNLYGAAPTLDALSALERKVLAKRDRDFGNKVPTVTTTPKSAGVHNNAVNDEISSDSVTKSSSCSTPKSTRSVKRAHSDDDTGIVLQPLQDTFNTFLEVASSSNYADRTNSGTVCISFGPKHLLQKATYMGQHAGATATVRLWGEQEGWLSSDTRYMYEVMVRKASCLNNFTQWLGQAFIKKHNLETDSFKKNITGNCTTYGRICCDADGKLNAASVLLEGSAELTNGLSISLNFSKLGSYSLFPGQVVAVQGTNLNGHSFVVQKLFTDTTLELPKEMPCLTGELQVVVAAGPFTPFNSLSYEPLKDFLKYVKDHKPNVMILIGPFIDINNKNIQEGDLIEDFNNFFESLVENIMTTVHDLNTQVVLVASHQDAHHHIVYPTPPYAIRKKFPNLHCVPDPSLLSINGVVIGTTSVDILFHLLKEEINYPYNIDRMGRLISHILNQQCFYPLYPPNKDMCIDHELLERYGTLQVIPHILILPSSLRYFIKNIDGCVVINPEKLAKGFDGGTFLRIQIDCGKIGTLSEDMACEIISI